VTYSLPKRERGRRQSTVTKRQKRQARVEVAAEVKVEDPPDPSPGITNRGGLNINLPQKFR
jgi:hypothetical protein